MPRQRLVDGVVRHFEHHVVQARAIVGIADIHAGALAHGIEALENLDRIGIVSVLLGGVFAAFGGVLVHAEYIGRTGPKTNALRAVLPTGGHALSHHLRVGESG